MKINELVDSYVKDVQKEVARTFHAMEAWEQKKVLKRLKLKSINDTQSFGKRELEKILKVMTKWEKDAV